MAAANLVLVGAVGWLHPAWEGAFYPDDLPAEWRLSYYNTQFEAVYLPASLWQDASPETWAAWLADTLEGFHFVLEPGDAAVVPPVSPQVVLATPAWQAEHVWWLDETPDLRRLGQRIAQQAATGEPLYVLSRSGDLALMKQAVTLARVMGY
ncbi:DUF72 domain-containing protein [Thiobacillus sp.]|uniref:DUF72 domain-containing protein n=1 Tax=Thiobacillus sp. TaxID=924 RepID=UPI0025EAEBF2|nr:DUF72 domain-containing protein [Thiobacillus sp.]